VCLFFSSLRRGLASASPPSSFCDLRQLAVINLRTNIVATNGSSCEGFAGDTAKNAAATNSIVRSSFLSFVHTFAAALAIDSERCAAPFF